LDNAAFHLSFSLRLMLSLPYDFLIPSVPFFEPSHAA